jgi:hypothetical protein
VSAVRDPRELHPGDNIVYLFDREHVGHAELANIQNQALTHMAAQWLDQYSHRFFLTVARNYQPVAGTKLHTFASHDDSVLFLDQAALLEQLPTLTRATAGCTWVMLATEDVVDAFRAAMGLAD